MLFFKEFKTIKVNCVNPVLLNTLTIHTVRRLEVRSNLTSIFTPSVTICRWATIYYTATKKRKMLSVFVPSTQFKNGGNSVKDDILPRGPITALAVCIAFYT